VIHSHSYSILFHYSFIHVTGENCTFEGPGHGSIVVDAAGDWWLAYHSWRFGHIDREPGRVMLLDKIVWRGFPSLELWPQVEGGVPSDTLTEQPSVSQKYENKQ